MATSLSAWAGVAGWVMYYFGVLTLIGPIVNICAVTMIAVVIALGMLLALVGVLGISVLAEIFALNIGRNFNTH